MKMNKYIISIVSFIFLLGILAVVLNYRETQSILGNAEKIDGLYFDDYQVYYKGTGLCEAYFQIQIYEDDDSIYYLGSSGCSLSDYYYVVHNDSLITIHDAIKFGLFDVDDVMEASIHVIVEEK